MTALAQARERPPRRVRKPTGRRDEISDASFADESPSFLALRQFILRAA